MISPLRLRMIVIAALLLVSSIPVRAADTPPGNASKETGDLWEVTSRMSMEGMPMEVPAQKAKFCAAKEWKEPPAQADEQQKCQNSDFRLEGQKATWKVRCAGPPPMTGDGEITRNGADAYTGAIRFASEMGTMTMKLDGKRLGACDLPKK